MNTTSEQYYENQNEILLFLFIIVLVFFLFLALWFNSIAPFLEERKYIKMNMNRSFKKSEYRYWKRQLKLLYLRSIPLIGRFFR